MKERVIPLPEAERVCHACGAELKPCGKKFIRDEWNFQPARLTVTRIYAETYYCPACKKEVGKKDSETGNNLVTAKVPDALIPHSMWGLYPMNTAIRNVCCWVRTRETSGEVDALCCRAGNGD